MPRFLDGALEEVVANPQWSGCVACSEKDQCSHDEFRITRVAREQTPVAERGQKLAEGKPDLLPLRIRNGRHNGDHTDQGPERKKDIH